MGVLTSLACGAGGVGGAGQGEAGNPQQEGVLYGFGYLTNACKNLYLCF